MSRQFQDARDDLTGQQKAVETYLELLASARESGPVDQMRWGAVMARVSRMTGIPFDELHARFRKKKNVARMAPAMTENLAAEAARTPEPTDAVEKNFREWEIA